MVENKRPNTRAERQGWQEDGPLEATGQLVRNPKVPAPGQEKS